MKTSHVILSVLLISAPAWADEVTYPKYDCNSIATLVMKDGTRLVDEKTNFLGYRNNVTVGTRPFVHTLAGQKYVILGQIMSGYSTDDKKFTENVMYARSHGGEFDRYRDGTWFQTLGKLPETLLMQYDPLPTLEETDSIQRIKFELKCKRLAE